MVAFHGRNAYDTLVLRSRQEQSIASEPFRKDFRKLTDPLVVRGCRNQLLIPLEFTLMEILSADFVADFVVRRVEVRLRGYCESCGTMDLHGCRCTTCGFSFEVTPEPSGCLSYVDAHRQSSARVNA